MVRNSITCSQKTSVFGSGALEATILYTPGHTKGDVTYLIGDAAFIGDTLFMTDYGSARADFPGGDARALYRSDPEALCPAAGDPALSVP